MSPQLHLPDLPEVPVALGHEKTPPPDQASAADIRASWRQRIGSLLGTAIPLLIMTLLALGSWWLVKNSPQPPSERLRSAPAHVPDYRLERFTLQRYDPSGRLKVQIQGEHLRHFPDTDEVEIDTVHVEGYDPDGRVTRATAREAIAAGDGSVVQLIGGAHVISTGNTGETVDFVGEHLLADFRAHVVRSERPVQVRQGRSEFTADAMVYDEASSILTLTGPARAVMTPDRSGKR
ncbi:LPS export ABC transporter periplasmic protein LptC [Ideonella azotifigens]|uniref:LPS export ABC transporter periplasmic protein LptC n=1 Tax=Ideonella azotifigens TaxID=513160 RepID=A0ABN1JQP8_9BURK|nr:LPS export ABC transporter periplasmic protein LptC [Ideonella azotifigens]MCD2340208.1 LPS export ABC transporter periplasmic protein LptC [Ideonella azotifigens]